MKTKLLKQTSITTISLWLGIFAITPLLLVFGISFLQHSTESLVIWHFTLTNYQQLLNPIFLRIILHSIILAFTTTIICLLIAYPAAFIIATFSKRYQSLLILLMIIPFWTSSIIRTYAMFALLEAHGLLNSVLIALGITHKPIQILYTNTAVLIGMVYNLLPYMILPLYSNIEKLNHHVFEAARDLGASRWKVLTDVMIPLTIPAIMAGTILVFLPAMTLFYIPDLLGGAKSLLIGNLIKQQFLSMNDWPGGSASSIVLTLIMLLLLFIYRRTNRTKNIQALL